MNRNFRLHQITAIFLAFFAFVMSALISRTVFERLPHLEDEVAYLFQARVFARGDLTIDIPDPRRAYWQPFVVDHTESGQRFGKYTPGWPAILSVGVHLGQEWVINAFFAALTVALTYRLAGEIFNRDVGLIAAALTAFSPMALLLNASLMGHSAALCCATLFMYAYWRIERGRNGFRWAFIAGTALGIVVISRPLTAVAIALPFVALSAVRLIHALMLRIDWSKTPLRAMLILAGCTLLISTAIPLFNAAATHNPRQNLYELVWSYDKVGFGECCGRNLHRLEKAVAHTRFDLSLTAADLFGWQLGGITPELQDHLRTRSDYWPQIGLSFVPLPFGVLISLFPKLRRDQRLGLGAFILWLIGAGIWVALALNLDRKILADPIFSWIWVLTALAWLLMPLYFLKDAAPPLRWTWLFLSITLGIVLVQMTYWIGSQRYSTRYYYEALTAAAILSAILIAALARKINRQLVYGALALLLIYSLYAYSTPRISALYQFNQVGRTLIDAVNQLREDDRPILVLITGPASGENQVRWRAYGSLMVSTSPYLDSEIVAAWDTQAEGVREAILERFPDRQVIEMEAAGNQAYFKDPSPSNDQEIP